MQNEEKIKDALAKIDTAVQNIESDSDWLSYLSFQAKFHKYSARNALLIQMQNPLATYVQGFKAWKKFDRYVKKGAKGIAILAPCIQKFEEYEEPEEGTPQYHDKERDKVIKEVLVGFTVKYVFDIADTDGSEEYLPVLVKGLSGDSIDENTLYEKLKAVINTDCSIIEVGSLEMGSAKGCYNREDNSISIRKDLEALQRIKTLLHEYAHSIDFKQNPDENIYRNRRELVAESAAFVISKCLGLDTSSYSVSYLQTWLNDKQELQDIADTVQRVAAHIIKRLAESDDPAFSVFKGEIELK